MKNLFLFSAVLLAACANLGQPATIGMSISEFQKSCGNSEQIIDVWGDELIGECSGKPDEYALFENGLVARVLTSIEVTNELVSGACGDNATCAKEVRAMVAQRTSAKNEMRRAQIAEHNAKLGAALSAAGQSFSAGATSSNSYTTTCFFKRESTSGMNKICYYDCLGSLTAVTQSAVSLCQQSISR